VPFCDEPLPAESGSALASWVSDTCTMMDSGGRPASASVSSRCAFTSRTCFRLSIT
jgi:hypothetical protein